MTHLRGDWYIFSLRKLDDGRYYCYYRFLLVQGMYCGEHGESSSVVIRKCVEYLDEYNFRHKDLDFFNFLYKKYCQGSEVSLAVLSLL